MGVFVWIALVVIRFLVCLYPGQMKGYIHPDQFFQTVEPLAGDIFGYDHYQTLDWNATAPSGPIRNVIFPYASVGASFLALKKLATSGLVSINGYTLQAFPRISMAATSLLADFAVYVTAKNLDLNHWNCLTILASSYVTLTFNTRTFTNVFEYVLFALVLMLVVMSHRDHLSVVKRLLEDESQNVKKKKKQTKASKEKDGQTKMPNPPSDVIVGFCLGVTVTIGTFCRPTFPVFFLNPLSFWITGTVTNLDVKALGEIMKRLASIIPGAIVALVCCLVIDSIYYGTVDAAILSNPQLLLENLGYGLLHNITVTPLNFVTYNIRNTNLATYGIHPRITHFLVNVPMLFLPLFIWLLRDAYSFYKTRSQNLMNELTLITSHKLLVLTFLTPILFLSLIPHQEPHYVLPVIIPLVLLYSDNLMRPQSPLPNVTWIVFNLLGCVLFGTLHQGGVVPCLEHLHNVATRPIDNNPTSFHFVFFHTYMPPRHLLYLQDKILPPFTNLTEDKYQDVLKHQEHIVTVHDLIDADSLEMFNSVDKILSDRHSPTPEPYKKEIYLVSPSSLDTVFCRMDVKYNFKLVSQFSPHLSLEDPPEWFPSYECVVEPERSYNHMNFRQKIRAMFSLFVYKVEMVTHISPES